MQRELVEGDEADPAPPWILAAVSAATGAPRRSAAATRRCASYWRAVQRPESPVCESFPPSYRKSPANRDLVEAAGIEPASAVAPNRASTSVVRACSHPPAGSRTTHRRASHPASSHLRRLALPWCQARLLAPNSGPRAQPGSTSPYLASTRRRVRVRSCSHLLWCRLIYEANRRPRLAALPENRPRRNLIAPVCVSRR